MAKRFDKPKFGHQSFHSSLSGVSTYMQRFHSDLIDNKMDFNQYHKWLNKMMKEFLQHINVEHKSGGKHADQDYNANVVQENFPKFRRHLKRLSKDRRNGWKID